MEEIKFKYYFENLQYGRIHKKIFSLADIADGEVESFLDENKEYSFFKCEQYTGLKDKNCVEIYKGDIVLANNRGHNENGLHYIIEYDNTNTCFFGNVDNLIHNKYKNAYHHQPMCDIRQNIEVVGNIYENKELLNDN